jgi:hypothetical protein
MRFLNIIRTVVLFRCVTITISNVVVNGDFENPVVPATDPPLIQATSQLQNWVVSSGNVDVVGYNGVSGWQAGSQSQSIDLNGNTAATISQQLTTQAGATYTLSYMVSCHPLDTVDKPYEVRWDGTLVEAATIYNNPSRTQANMMWQTKQFTVQASSTTTLLEFASKLQVGESNSNGPALDNVVVTYVTAAPTHSTTATVTATGSITCSATSTPSYTPTTSFSKTQTMSPSATPTLSATLTVTPSSSHTVSASVTVSAHDLE